MSFDNEDDDLDLRQQQEIDNLYRTGQIPDFNDWLESNAGGNGHNKPSSEDPSNPNSNVVIRKLPEDKNYFEYIVNSVKKTVRCEDGLIRQILYTGFSAHIEDDPINLGVLAPTSEGKTYPIIESLQYFPKEDVQNIGKMSKMVLVRQKDILIDKITGEPIEPIVKQLKTQIRQLTKERNSLSNKDREGKAEINDKIGVIEEQITTIYENSKTLIDLAGKILLFLEPPEQELWNLLKPILSHDKREIEFPFVDQDKTTNAKSRDVVVRNWPACIFCSAKDESKMEIWAEIKSRILVTSPNMVPKKYKQSNELLSQTKGLPNSIQQKIIISDERIQITKNCVLTIKDSIKKLKEQSNGSKTSVWIPYYKLLQQELPANKGTDVRFAKRVFALLDIVPIVKSNLRSILLLENEKSVIANLDDLLEVLSITHNFDGLPKFKAEFFNDIFLELFDKKKEIGPDSSEDGKKVEDIPAVTTRQLGDYNKTKTGKSITSDHMKKTYLNSFINEGLIDHLPSKLDRRQEIYYPLVTEKISLISIMDRVDNLSQQKPELYEKIIRKMSNTWLNSEIRWLIQCRFGKETKEDGDNSIDKNLKIQVYREIPQSVQQVQGNNTVLESELDSTTSIMIEVDQPVSDFIDQYIAKVLFRVDIKRRHIWTLEGKISPKIPTHAKIDNKDIISPDNTESQPLKCYYCLKEFDTSENYAMHVVRNHPGQSPDPHSSKELPEEFDYGLKPDKEEAGPDNY